MRARAPDENETFLPLFVPIFYSFCKFLFVVFTQRVSAYTRHSLGDKEGKKGGGKRRLISLYVDAKSVILFGFCESMAMFVIAYLISIFF